MAGMNPSMPRTERRIEERRAPAPERGPRLLMSWEDWFTLAAAALVFLSLAGSIQAANLVRDMPPIIPTTIAGLVAGLFAARIRASQFIIHPAVALIGAGVVVLAAQGYAEGATLQDRIADFRLRMEEWFLIVRAGDISNDNLPFVTLVHSVAFLVAYIGTWAVYRWHNAWLAVIPVGVLLLANISVVRGQPSTAFVFFLFGALLLVARMHLQKRQADWQRDGVEYPEFISLSVAQLTVILAAGLMIFAWMVPLGTQARAVESSISWATKPVSDYTDHLVRIFHNVNLRGGGELYTYGDTLPIHGDISLSSRQIYEISGIDALDQMQFLRAASYDEYTGVGWKATDRTQTRVDGGTFAIDEDRNYRARAFSEIQVVVRDSNSIVLFRGTPFGTNVRTMVESSSASPGDVEQVQSRRNLRDGDTYNAIGTVSIASADQLRAAGTNYPAWVQERYLQLPDDLPDSVRLRAAEIAAGMDNPYDVARAIQAELRQIPYDLSVPAAPPGRDPVEFLLNDLPAGHFLYQATAMAVMLRNEGIPARIAIGYVLDPAWLEGGPPYPVTREDAYAWVEVFFPEYGWVNFNPTGDRPAGGAAGSSPLDSTDITPGEDILPFIDEFLEFDEIGGLPPEIAGQLNQEPVVSGESFPWWVIWTLVGAMFVAAAAVSAGYVGWNWGMGGMPARVRLWAKTQRLSRWAGLSDRDGETPREWSRRVGRTLGDEGSAIRLASAYEEARYGRPDLQRIEDEEATNAYRRIRAALIRRIAGGKSKRTGA